MKNLIIAAAMSIAGTPALAEPDCMEATSRIKDAGLPIKGVYHNGGRDDSGFVDIYIPTAAELPKPIGKGKDCSAIPPKDRTLDCAPMTAPSR